MYNPANCKPSVSALTRFLAIVLFLACLAVGASAQYRDVYLGIKTGNESGAGSYGSKIKVKITFVNNTGATEVGESWLGNATLERDGWSWAKLSMRYDQSLDPAVKMIRLENHGTNSAITGDNWLCEWVCVSYDGNLCSARFEIHEWINGGAWVEKDNPSFRPPTRPEPRPQPEPRQSDVGIPASAPVRRSPEQVCAESIRGKVAWNRAGNTEWAEENIKNLCQGTTNPNATIACFRAEIQRNDNWPEAISTCKAGGQPATLVAALVTASGHYVTVVNGGGLGGPNTGSDAVPIHTDATSAGAWETFTVVWLDDARKSFALKTVNGNYLTAENSGGIGGPNDSTSPIHTDATEIGSWQKLTIRFLPNGKATIQTPSGHYLGAVNGGGMGRPNDAIVTNRTKLGNWEIFKIVR